MDLPMKIDGAFYRNGQLSPLSCLCSILNQEAASKMHLTRNAPAESGIARRPAFAGTLQCVMGRFLLGEEFQGGQTMDF